MAVDVQPAAPFSGTDRDTSGGGGPMPPSARRRWSLKRIAIAVTALAVLGGVLLFTGGSGEESATGDDPAQDTAPALSGELEDGFVVFTDPETGIVLQHPETWVPRTRPEGSQRLLLSAGAESSVLVRVDPIEGTVDTPEMLAQIQATTDRIAAAPGVQVVKREPVEINGMLGISYLSRFTDEASGTKAANAQYFLFQGNTMYNLLFQAAPEEEFDRLAPQFNQVLASFQGVPAENPPPPPADG